MDNRTNINSCPLNCSLPKLRDNPDFYSQKKQLPIIKEDLVKVSYSGELLDFKSVPSQTLQDVSKRVDLAYGRFLAGDCNGKHSGKPRFKNVTAQYGLKVKLLPLSILRKIGYFYLSQN